jgi:hypothetical protein
LSGSVEPLEKIQKKAEPLPARLGYSARFSAPDKMSFVEDSREFSVG